MATIPPKLKSVYQTAVQRAKRLYPKDFGMVLPFFVVAVLAVAILTAIMAYQAGERQGRLNSTITTDYKGRPITAEDIQHIRLDNDLLKSEVSTLIQERDISQNNLNLIREEMHELRAERDEFFALSEALSLHAISNGEPIQVIDVQVKNLGEKAFEYRLDILIPSTTNQLFVPKLTLINATSMVNVPIKPSSYQTKGLTTVRGRFVMPEGFVPSQLRLTLNVADKQLIKLYNWKAGK